MSKRIRIGLLAMSVVLALTALNVAVAFDHGHPSAVWAHIGWTAFLLIPVPIILASALE